MGKTTNILILLVLVNLTIGGGVWWTYTQINEKKVEETELSVAITEEGQKGGLLSQMRRTLDAVRPAREKLGRYVYTQDEDSQIRFVTEIENLGVERTGVNIETRSFDVSGTKEKVFRAELSVRGSWAEIFHLLRLLEEFPGRVSITRVDVRGGGRDAASQGGEWTGSITLELLSVKQGIQPIPANKK